MQSVTLATTPSPSGPCKPTTSGVRGKLGQRSTLLNRSRSEFSKGQPMSFSCFSNWPQSALKLLKRSLVAVSCHWNGQARGSVAMATVASLANTVSNIWILRNLSFRCISFHEKRLQTMLWHHNAWVNSHQRWKQTRFRVCFHLWCELTNTMNVTEWQVSWNSCWASMAPRPLCGFIWLIGQIN